MDNNERQQLWYMTFGCGQPNAGHYVKIYGTFEEARAEMFKRYGKQWAFQYSEEEWKIWENTCKSNGLEYLETEIELNDCK